MKTLLILVNHQTLVMNKFNTPRLKKVEPNFGRSFVLRSFEEKNTNQIPKWHYHPELELVYIEEGKGKYQIGNSINYFTEGDLVLIGSNVPHYGFSSRLSGENQELVIQIHPSCFGEGFLDMSELTSIKTLFDNAKLGLSFHGITKEDIGERLKSMFYMTSFEKVIELIKIFHILSESKEYKNLNSYKHAVQIKKKDITRIEVVYDFVRERFEEKILVEEIADAVHMSEPAFCRFFKKSTGKTFINFLNEYRVTHACKLITENPDLAITEIAFQSGYNNLSNFNRAFKKVTGKNPSAYKNGLTVFVS